jgi:hypothetical protein
MRCLPIRSVFRAALLAGLIGSSQYATASASWKDCMPPRNGSCFIHDLHWERFQPQPIGAVSMGNSALQVDNAKSEVIDLELKTCIAASKQFELKQQAAAIQAAIESNVAKIPNLSKQITASFAQSKKMFFTFFENKNLKLAKTAISAETLPVLAVVPQEESAYDCDWNCGDWCQGYSRPSTISLPSRHGANLFVYTFETSTAPSNDSNCPGTVAAQSDGVQIVDSCAVAYSEYIGDNLLTEAENSQWNSAVAAEFPNPWQLGIDPVCAEVQSTEIANLSLSSDGKHSVCCPIEHNEEAVATVPIVADASIASVDVVSVDVADNVRPDFAVRPPILEAESEINSSNPTMEFSGQRPVHCLISDFDAGTFRGDYENDMIGGYDYESPWLSSINASSWRSGFGKRFAFGDNTPRIPISPSPVAAFSMEDLQFTNRFSADLLGKPTEQVADLTIKEPKMSSEANESFLSKDFLTTLQTSAYGSIILPVNQTQRMAMDYAMKLIADPASTSRIHASRKVAKQLRTVGQFLVDFAIQIENRVEQVEIARGENSQRENNQR